MWSASGGGVQGDLEGSGAGVGLKGGEDTIGRLFEVMNKGRWKENAQ